MVLPSRSWRARMVCVCATCMDDGYDVHYTVAGRAQTVVGRLIVNCTGAWVNEVLQCIHPQPGRLDMELVLGTHILLPGRLEQGMYYLEIPQDQRAVFVMPWEGGILVGTTETPVSEPCDPVPPEADIEYLLVVYNHYFHAALCRDQVLSVFAGLRVLPAGGERVFSRSRAPRAGSDDATSSLKRAVFGNARLAGGFWPVY